MEVYNTTLQTGHNATNYNVTAIATNVHKTEYVIREWPQWVNITVPLICIISFIIVMVIIFLKPSKPDEEPWCFSSKSPQKNTQVEIAADVEEIELGNGTRRTPNYVPTEYC